MFDISDWMGKPPCGTPEPEVGTLILGARWTPQDTGGCPWRRSLRSSPYAPASCSPIPLLWWWQQVAEKVDLDTYGLPSYDLLSCSFKTTDGRLHTDGSMVVDEDARQVGLYLPDGSPAGTGLKEK